ncbi:Uracil-DNA glycosylase, family 4 [hydrothermal vent metagenome]|uniref:Type-4 uracil-DNA glycosylase n=1 Tax=hydrothermal vent metagenome TaxID=652676 RepID=A0A3B0ZZE6_9ZZZZ
MTLDPQQQAYLSTIGIDLYQAQSMADSVGATIDVKNQDQQSGLSQLDWDGLSKQVETCVECDLHSGRSQTVFGVGNQQADLLIIGEAPGAEEDRQGEPFVGRAGQLLNEMLKAIGFNRNQIYIANILKCRPPNNRDPKPEEAECCVRYLYRQIELLKPRLILAVGRIAAQRLLSTNMSLAKLRSRLHELKETQTPFIVTYHPAYLLRAPGEKRKAWEDLLFVKQTLDNSDSN